MRLEQLSSSYFEQSASLLKSAWQEFAHNTELAESSRFDKSDACNWLSNFMNNGGIGFVAVDGDLVAGVVTCSVVDSPGYFRDPKHLLVNDIAVLEKYRRQGIAQKLEDRIEQYARDNDVNLVLGEIYAYNEASRSLMRKIGRRLAYEVWYKRLSDDQST